MAYLTEGLTLEKDTTLMSEICNQILVSKNLTSTDLSQYFRINCTNWFDEVFEHCSGLILETNSVLPTVFTTLYQFLTLQFIFNTDKNTELANQSENAILIYPNQLSKLDCVHLFIDIARDYINLARKFIYCNRENFYLDNFLHLILLITLISLLIKFSIKSTKKIFSYSGTQLEKILKIYDRNKTKESSMESIEKFFNGKMLKRNFYECKHLQLNGIDPENFFHDKHLFIKIGKKNLSETLYNLVQTNGTIQKLYKNGKIGEMRIAPRNFLRNKIIQSLNESKYMHITIAIDTNSSDKFEINCNDNNRKLDPVKEISKESFQKVNELKYSKHTRYHCKKQLWSFNSHLKLKDLIKISNKDSRNKVSTSNKATQTIKYGIPPKWNIVPDTISGARGQKSNSLKSSPRLSERVVKYSVSEVTTSFKHPCNCDQNPPKYKFEYNASGISMQKRTIKQQN